MKIIFTLAFALGVAHSLDARTHVGTGGQGKPDSDVIVAVGATSTDDMIARAQTWVNVPVPYSQSEYYDGYRQDCSGYVSMAWNLGISAVTWTLPDYSYPIDKSSLRAGDILLNIDEHVLMFSSWVDDSQSYYWAYEQTPPYTIYHQVMYPYWSGYGVYEPYRMGGTSAALNATAAEPTETE
jgi:hypothetical protein